jgi:hypothetical protein
VNFSFLATVAPLAKPQLEIAYNWWDIQPLVNNNFYRVKATDNSGKIYYSSILYINTPKKAPQPKVFPNPVHDRILTVQMNDMDKGVKLLKLVNAMGRVMMQTQVDLNNIKGSNYILHLDNCIPNGNYFLEITAADGTGKQVVAVVVAN